MEYTGLNHSTALYKSNVGGTESATATSIGVTWIRTVNISCASNIQEQPASQYLAEFKNPLNE
jgi:hypothetical protein